MDNKQIESLLVESLDLAEAHVSSDGSHFQVIAVSDQFATMSRVKKQQFVYAPLSEKISEGSMHAVSIKAFTEEQWRKEKIFNPPQ